MERMAQNGNIEMSQAFYMEVWNGYERSKELEEENKNLKERVEELEKEKRRDGLLGQSTMEEAYNRIIELEEENKKLKLENAKLKDRIITDENFEEKLDKENKKLKEELEKLKSTYVYDAKQVRDIC